MRKEAKKEVVKEAGSTPLFMSTFSNFYIDTFYISNKEFIAVPEAIQNNPRFINAVNLGIIKKA